MKHLGKLAIMFLGMAIVQPAHAQAMEEGSAEHAGAEEAEGPHHLSLVVAGTHVDDEDTALTLGIDYEYRVSKLLGLGFVAERAFGELDATTLLAVADIHLWGGLALQIGPGIEFADDEEVAVARFGAVYEFEFGEGFTFAPQMHLDISDDEEALVFGAAIGRAF